MQNNIHLLKGFVILAIICLLPGCAPIIVTGAAATTYVLAKDQTLNQTANDIRIKGGIRAGFLKNNFKNLYSKITIEVSNGRVFYVGTVPSEQDVITALRIAWQQPGVKEVVNNLTIDENTCFLKIKDYATDILITSEIKSKLLANKFVKVMNFNIITYKGEVYIFGQARTVEELHKVAEIAAEVKGVKRVIDNVIIMES